MINVSIIILFPIEPAIMALFFSSFTSVTTLGFIPVIIVISSVNDFATSFNPS